MVEDEIRRKRVRFFSCVLVVACAVLAGMSTKCHLSQWGQLLVMVVVIAVMELMEALSGRCVRGCCNGPEDGCATFFATVLTNPLFWEYPLAIALIMTVIGAPNSCKVTFLNSWNWNIATYISLAVFCDSFVRCISVCYRQDLAKPVEGVGRVAQPGHYPQQQQIAAAQPQAQASHQHAVDLAASSAPPMAAANMAWGSHPPMAGMPMGAAPHSDAMFMGAPPHSGAPQAYAFGPLPSGQQQQEGEGEGAAVDGAESGPPPVAFGQMRSVTLEVDLDEAISAAAARQSHSEDSELLEVSLSLSAKAGESPMAVKSAAAAGRFLGRVASAGDVISGDYELNERITPGDLGEALEESVSWNSDFQGFARRASDGFIVACKAIDPDMECIMCLGQFESGEILAQLNCGHFFHKDCVLEWFDDGNGHCPYCRADVRNYRKQRWQK